MRELRRDIDATVETRRYRSLPLQRLRPLLQDERPEPTSHQAETTAGKYLSWTAFFLSFFFIYLHDTFGVDSFGREGSKTHTMFVIWIVNPRGEETLRNFGRGVYEKYQNLVRDKECIFRVHVTEISVYIRLSEVLDWCIKVVALT